MGQHNDTETYFYCNGQKFDGIQDVSFDPEDGIDPLESFLNMKPLDLAYTIAYDYGKMVSCILSPRHGAIYRRTKKLRVRNKYINRCNRIFKEMLEVEKP